MLKAQLAVYLGKDTENGFFGFIPEEKFFLVVDIEEGLSKELGREMLNKIKKDFQIKKVGNLTDFENFINEEIKNYNLPAGLSLATGLVVDNICYLKTIGSGLIFLQRKNKLTKIIEGEKTASGFIEKKDFFVLTTTKFVNLFGEKNLERIFDNKKPNQVVESLASEMNINRDSGVVALFLQFFENEIEYRQQEKRAKIVTKPQVLEKTQLFLTKLLQKFQDYQAEGGKKRTLTMGLAVVIVIILFWSVGLGVVRRQEGLTNEKIKKSEELITQKLDQAEEVASLNLPRAQALVIEARKELNSLKKEVKEDRAEIKEIENLINKKENKIVKKEDKKYEEFYDLTLDKKEAQGDSLYLNEDTLAILDKAQGAIYLLSLSKKSLDKVINTEIKNASTIAAYQYDTFFLVPSKGIYKVGEDGRAKIVIKYDKDWGKIKSMSIYNGNIYLLDSGKSKIYKYIVAEDGYGEKIDYLKSEDAISLDQATSLMIDSSLYIGFPDYTAKFTAGGRETFRTSFPDENFNLTKIFTTKDLEKVYSWDKDKGSLYILSKNGTYEKQIQSTILGKGNDIVVYDDVCYVLIKEKIYQVDLD